MTSMKVSEYFMSATKPIRYQRNLFKSVDVKDDCAYPQLFRLEDWLIGNPEAPTERGLARAYALKKHVDFTMQQLDAPTTLCENLQMIEDAIEKGALRIAAINLWDLYPPYTEKVNLLDQEENLMMLYLLYVCYRVLIWEDRNVSAEWFDLIRNSFSKTAQPSWNRQTLCWHYVSFVSVMMQDRTIYASMAVVNHEVKEFLYANSLFDALIYQLLLYFAAGEDGRGGGSIAECESCHKPFKKIHGNQRFCPRCATNTERARAYKNRKKGEKSHAPQSNP